MASTRLGYLAVRAEQTLPPTVTPIKPNNFIRFKEGDVLRNLTILANDPIQNQRWKAINAVSTTEASEGDYMFDLDPNDCVHFLRAGLGDLVSADISSLTDGSVYEHTLNMANQLPSLSMEQGKGNLEDTTNNLQNYQVDRIFGAMVDTWTIAGSDGILEFNIGMKAHGVFQIGNLVSDAAAGAGVDIALDTVEGLTTADTVNIFDVTPQNETDAIASIDLINKTIEIATLGNTYTVANLAKVELVPQTPSYTTPAEVMTFCDVTFQFGTDLAAAALATPENIEDWELSYENQLEERYGSLRCSPSVIAPKGAMMKLTYTKYFENVTDRDRYLNSLSRAAILTISNNKIISATDTLQAKYEIKVSMNSVIFNSYANPTGTDELYAASIEAEAYYSETDGKAVEIVVQNAKAGTLYTA